jgi:hypothetical protein
MMADERGLGEEVRCGSAGWATTTPDEEYGLKFEGVFA